MCKWFALVNHFSTLLALKVLTLLLIHTLTHTVTHQWPTATFDWRSRHIFTSATVGGMAEEGSETSTCNKVNAESNKHKCYSHVQVSLS